MFVLHWASQILQPVSCKASQFLWLVRLNAVSITAFQVCFFKANRSRVNINQNDSDAAEYII